MHCHRAQSHDLWIVPPESALPNTTATFRAYSGMDFPKGVSPVDPANFKSRRILLPEGTYVELIAAGSEENAGLLTHPLDSPGIYIATVQTEPKLIALDANAFNAYLVSDGLPHIYQLRSDEGTLDRPSRERYSKSPKALVQVGQGGGGDPCRVLGLPLEVVPLQNPFDRTVGDTLRVKVLFQGQALADAHLGWDHPDDGEPASGTVRTDANGEAFVPIRQLGLMTIRLTHMTRPNAEDVEWESFWTTLTFRIPGQGVAPRTTQQIGLQPIRKMKADHLPNAIQVHPKVISGGLPNGELAFQELQRLGVKTIISVDGAPPDLPLARRFGMRYVHLPHGYDGIPEQRVRELAKAVRDLDGPIYIHCHHGKHRSPAAATAACITAGFIEPALGPEVLKLAGTSENYVGLFKSVASANVVDSNQLDTLPTEYPESAQLPPLVASMVQIERAHDRLKQLDRVGWRSLPKHPDIDAAHEALMLTEHFAELLRWPIVSQQPEGFATLLRKSESGSRELDEAIRRWNRLGNPSPVPATIREPMERISAQCVSCHRSFRDSHSALPK
jgi:rhodanese-related sulfurtransferase